MADAEGARFAPVPDPPRPGRDADFGVWLDTGRHGIVRRDFKGDA